MNRKYRVAWLEGYLMGLLGGVMLLGAILGATGNLA